MPLWYFFHSFGFWWVPNFGVYHVYSCLTCFDHWFVFYTLLPTCAFLMPCSCIAHSHLMHTHFLPLSCLGLYLVSSSLVCHVYFMFCSILFLRYFFFCLSFISHSSCAPHASLPLFIAFFLSLLPFYPFVYLWQKGREYTREYCHFYMTFVHILRGRNSISCAHW